MAGEATATSDPPGKRELRPFPAIDPEPDRRFTRRTLVKAVIVVGACCVLAAGVVTGVRLAGQPAAAPHRAAAAPFTDNDGVIVFEQQPSGVLGTAAPDGSHLTMDKSLGGLQGNDLPVADEANRYLVNQEAQLITVGAHGPSQVSQLTAADPLAAAQSGGLQWASSTFADGGRYIAVTECDPVARGSNFTAWYSWLVPVTGGKPLSLGLVTSSVGLPGSASVIATLPASPAQAKSHVTCGQVTDPDGSLAILSPGAAPRVVITGAALVKAAGWKAGTPVTLGASPSPDGSLLLASVSDISGQPAAQAGNGIFGEPTALFLIGPAGRVLSQLPAADAGRFAVWSPQGKSLAFCHDLEGQPSAVTVLPVSPGGTVGGTRTIALPGRHDPFCNQLLWSPDGSQLGYGAYVTTHGLTQADSLQRGWTIIDLRSGAVHDVKAPGQPAAWLAGSAAS